MKFNIIGKRTEKENTVVELNASIEVTAEELRDGYKHVLDILGEKDNIVSFAEQLTSLLISKYKEVEEYNCTLTREYNRGFTDGLNMVVTKPDEETKEAKEVF